MIALPCGILGSTTVCCTTPCAGSADICAFETFKAAPPATSAEAKAVISGYTDPVVRSAAVGLWTSLHPEISPDEGSALCGLLEQREQRGCLRRVTSPHLQPR
jgi:hypothetical protein